MNDEVEHKLNLGDHAAVFCAALGGFVNLYATQALYPVLQSRYDASVADAGTLLTATTLGLAMAAPFAGRVAHRVGPRGAILTGMAALAGCTLLIAMAHAYAQLLLMRLAQGLMIPVVLSALLSGIGARWSGGAALALSATYVTGTVIGGLLGRFVPALLLPGLGWTGTFVCFSAAQALLLLPVWRLYPSVQLAEAPQLPVRTWAAAIWPTLRDKLVGVSAAGFCLLFTQAAVTTYIAIRLASPPYAWGTAALGALYAVFLPALGFVRLTPRVMSALGAGRTLAAALALAWLGLALTLMSPAPAIVIGLTLFSVAVFIGQTVLAHLVGHAPTGNRELAAGIYLSCYYLGGSAGAWLPALLWPRFGWVGCIALTAAVQLAGLALATAGRRRWHTAC